MIQDVFIMLFAGLVAGLVGGLLGLGGGIVLMPVLRFVLGYPPEIAAGTCILAVFCTTAGGSWRHYREGHIEYRSLIPVILAGAVTTLIFSILFVSAAGHPRFLDLGIGVVFCVVAVRMIRGGLRHRAGRLALEQAERSLPGTTRQKLVIGASAGVLPGLFGIGTGAILVPVFTILLGAQIKVAIGSSLACFMVNAAISSAFKLFQGFVDLGAAVPLCVGTVVGANLGARINRRSPSSLLKLVFGLMFLVVAARFIYSGLTK